MTDKEEEFLRTLRATFRLEAEEHLQVIATALLELEKGPAAEARRELVDRAFRAAHSLKGAARAVDFSQVESACEALEDSFAGWKSRQETPTTAALDALHRSIHAIGTALGLPARAGEAAPPAEAAPRAPARESATHPAPQPVDARPPARTAARTATAEQTVRIPVSSLDARLLEAEEMLTAKLTARQRAVEVRELSARLEPWRREYIAVEPAARLLRAANAAPRTDADAGPMRLMARLLEFLEWNAAYFRSLEDTVEDLHRTLQLDSHTVGRLVDDLLENAKRLLLLPFSSVTMPFPRLVRDVCRDLGKDAELILLGDTVRMDKRVLEEIKDPLVHLLRNALDHGIEAPDDRERAGKRRRGSITVAASHTDGSIVRIVVADDGAGIDLERVKASAVERGVFSAQEALELPEAAAARLIFEGDVSTSTRVTRLSGRGLGLAIVNEKVQKLGGTVTVESRRGEGTRFTLALPATLATFRGVLVEAASRPFVAPTHLVERALRVAAGEVRRVEGRDTIVVDGRVVPFVSLADVLELPPGASRGTSGDYVMVLVLGAGEGRIAFAVDAILDEQEVLVKALRPPLTRVRNIAGATVLASGAVVPILNVGDLLKSARLSAPGRSVGPASAAEAEPASVLVAEDSITSRMLLKGILESAGYRVKTAVDGMDALALLRGERFDLLVSDVEMPRLNGFDLASRIRADRTLAELPIILVTTLESPEDRARGIEAGVNAYIVKSSFDQSDLLDAVRRLI